MTTTDKITGCWVSASIILTIADDVQTAPHILCLDLSLLVEAQTNDRKIACEYTTPSGEREVHHPISQRVTLEEASVLARFVLVDLLCDALEEDHVAHMIDTESVTKIARTICFLQDFAIPESQ